LHFPCPSGLTTRYKEPMNDADRLMNLEQLFTHLERHVAELHSVVVDQQRQLELLQKQLRLLESRLAEPQQEPDDDQI